jgi:hypothetical protein
MVGMDILNGREFVRNTEFTTTMSLELVGHGAKKVEF